ncbi:hypothetical protein SXANM310S_03752 [Streptomyces xanthochromogenes]
MDGARARLFAAPGPVQRELGDDRPRQPVLPVVQPAFQPVAGELLALPDGEVRVLGRHRGQAGFITPRQRLVGRAQFTQDDAHRPTVGGDVMSRQQQDVRCLGLAQQEGPQQGPRTQVERRRVLREQCRVEAVRRYVADRQGHRRCRVHVLGRAAVALLERGPQCLVPGHDLGERTPESPVVEGAGEAHGDRAVVAGVTGVQPVQEPQPLLGERQGQGPVAVGARDAGGRAAGARRGTSGQSAAQGLAQIVGQGFGAVSPGGLRRRHVRRILTVRRGRGRRTRRLRVH